MTDQFIANGLGCFNADVQTTNLVSVSSRVKNKEHETQKPVELMELLIKLVTKENQTVLDMFAGSGTTGVACKNLNRSFIGIEMDENYFSVAKKRILGENNA